MSNNVVSQYPISDGNAVQMEHGSNSMDMSSSEMHKKMGSVMTGSHGSHNLYESTEQRGWVDPLYSNAEFAMVPNSRLDYNKSSGVSMVSNSNLMADQLIGEDASMVNDLAIESTAYPVKRKAELGHLSNSSVQPKKQAGLIGADVHSLGFSKAAVSQRTTESAQSKYGFHDLADQPSPKKKMARNDSISGRSGMERSQATKKQPNSLESRSKGRPEPLEAVRSKMRESLTSALALAFGNQGNISNIVKNPSVATTQAAETNFTTGLVVCGSDEFCSSKESALLGKTDDSQIFSTPVLSDESSGIGGKSFEEFQYSSGLPDEVVPFGDVFFAQDDLLQGHGLSWAFDFDIHMRNVEEVQNDEKPESMNKEDREHGGGAAIMTPENLAFEIEAELFKLFGEVNKKYREKGRSLLFNLRDQNNPELRERVMSGEISPEKLCSMSAEELASKELSQWRMAKAKEMAQMVVLPDTEVDIRRLVRKTHKGEFQVEVEHDDGGIAADVSGGTSMLIQHQPEKETEPQSSSQTSSRDKEKIAGQESNSEEQEPSGSVVIPTSGSDLMQEMMVDELKDAEFLPPIVSLDEFTESRNSGPPHNSLSKDAVQKTPVSSSFGESPKSGSSTSKDAPSRMIGNVKKLEVEVTIPSGSNANLKLSPSGVPKVEYIWDGVLKLSTSSSVTVGGIFQSGERTTTKEWPRTLEMKGRVRFEAFEKFLQELPMSRTRVVMVVHLVLKDKSNTSRSNLSNAIEAYSADKRLGYAEPVRGTELYLCPPTSRIVDILNRQMHKEYPQIVDSVEKDYLIGVIVWRRTILSPNSSSHHHKHVSKKQQTVSLPKRVQDTSTTNTTPSQAPPPMTQKQIQEENVDDDDDIPPGFGPGAAAQLVKDDDDLPEYNFSGAVNPSTPRLSSSQNLQHGMKLPPRPVDQVREMIKKYGQSETNSVNQSSWADDKNLGFEPWNDEKDEDDDIPEWNPEPSHRPHNQQLRSYRMLPTTQHLAQQSQQHGRREQTGRWGVQPPQSKRWSH